MKIDNNIRIAVRCRWKLYQTEKKTTTPQLKTIFWKIEEVKILSSIYLQMKTDNNIRIAVWCRWKAYQTEINSIKVGILENWRSKIYFQAFLCKCKQTITYGLLLLLMNVIPNWKKMTITQFCPITCNFVKLSNEKLFTRIYLQMKTNNNC